MDLLIILTYTAICIVIFKVFKIPLNKWTVPTAVLGGVAILSALLLLMNYNHPYAKYGKEVFTTIPIVPEVTGTVESIEVTPNIAVKQGDILFKLKSTEQELTLAKAEAALAQARTGDLQENEALQSVQSKVSQAKANRDRTKSTYQRYKQGYDQGGEFSPFSEQELDTRKQLYLGAEAAYQSALAEKRRLEVERDSQYAGEDTKVAQLIAARDLALLNYQRTIVRAPVDGIPTQIAMRPGTRATSLPLRPVMTFIPKEKRVFAAAFFQNSLLRLEKGLPAEVVLDAVPGVIFTGKVIDVLPGMAEGEVQAQGNLISSQLIMRPGFVIGLIEIDQDLNEYNLPLGVKGQAVALNYEHDILHVSVVRRILLRMMSWLKYVYPIK